MVDVVPSSVGLSTSQSYRIQRPGQAAGAWWAAGRPRHQCGMMTEVLPWATGLLAGMRRGDTAEFRVNEPWRRDAVTTPTDDAAPRSHPGDHASPTSGALHPYVEALFAADPILASQQGDGRRSDVLGEIDPSAIEEQCRARRDALYAAEAVAVPTAGTVEWLEHQVLLTELRTAVARDEDIRVWQRAPYWYPERLGQALSVLMSGDDVVPQGEALLGRLREIPGYLSTATANLAERCPAALGRDGSRFRTRAVALPDHGGPRICPHPARTSRSRRQRCRGDSTTRSRGLRFLRRRGGGRRDREVAMRAGAFRLVAA